MNKRPKSREETPKEGSDSARRYRTATICGRAAQKARVFESFPVRYGPGGRIGNAAGPRRLFKYYHILNGIANSGPAAVQCWYAKTRDFVIEELTKNPRLKRSQVESRFESRCLQDEWEKYCIGRARQPGLG
jgi:hypothetical protein